MSSDDSLGHSHLNRVFANKHKNSGIKLVFSRVYNACASLPILCSVPIAKITSLWISSVVN